MLRDQYKQFVSLLLPHLSDDAKGCILSPDRHESDQAVCAWLDSIHEEGETLEIGSQYSASGRPVIVNLRG